MSTWTGYMLLGNGWTETITNVAFSHTADGEDPDTLNEAVLNTGEVSKVLAFTAYSNKSDNWTVTFQTADGGTHGATIKDAGFKEEDKDAILFAQVTKKNGRFTLYFPVSSDNHTSIS